MDRLHFFAATGIERISACTKDDEDDLSDQNDDGKPELHVMADREMSFWSVDENHSPDQNRNLHQTHDSRKEPGDNQWSAEDVSEDNIMGEYCPGKPGADSGCRVLKLRHMCDELK